jgi:hypothetical protein
LIYNESRRLLHPSDNGIQAASKRLLHVLVYSRILPRLKRVKPRRLKRAITSP